MLRFNSLVNQTTPFCSTRCIASPARRREGLVTLAQFLKHNPECWYDQFNEITAGVLDNEQFECAWDSVGLT